MKNGKAEVISVKLEHDGGLRVMLASREDRDRFLDVLHSICAKGTVFDLIGDTQVLCRLPQPSVMQ